MPSPEPGRPWGGYDSLEAQVDALRRARFQVADAFQVVGRGWVLRGTIAEGEVKGGMVLLAQLEELSNIVVAVPIRAVESIHGGAHQDAIALVLGDVAEAAGGHSILMTPGTVIDVLEHAPAA
jgi:hypothetical protein